MKRKSNFPQLIWGTTGHGDRRNLPELPLLKKLSTNSILLGRLLSNFSPARMERQGKKYEFM